MNDPALADQNVLVVDDSATYLALLEGELTDEGYRVFAAKSGEAAVVIAAENSLDCAVVDLVMPGMDGIELCRKLLGLNNGAALLPVLIITARGSQERMMQALEVGAEDYVEKDGDLTVLKARLRALLRRKVLQDEHQRIRDEMRDQELELVRLKAAGLEMETRLVQGQKMEALGRLTGGVAHDFNNLLTVIMGNLQLLQRNAGDDPTITGRLDKIMNAARSGAELTRRLLSFSRQQVLETGPVDINDVVRDTSEMVERTIPDNVTVTTVTTGEPSLGVTDRDQLAHALINLCVNARDAMPKGGKLTIETRRTVLDASYAMAHGDVKPGAYVEIAVSDTGTGIPPHIIGKIFEPFFTTKEKGKGTGLGLATIFGFMKQSGGHVSVYSEVGHGSTFRLFVPAADSIGAEKSPAAKTNGAAEARPVHNATILVVEDEDAVRDIATSTLRNAGFNVIEASSGPAGLKAFDDHPDIAAVFSDVLMPGGMSGPEMVARIRERRPDVPVLFASGYAEQALRDTDALVGRARFIAKPYDGSDLAERLERILEGNGR